MKTFEQLTKTQKQDAIDMEIYEIVDNIALGILDVTLANPASQVRFERILQKARKTESPRLIKLHLLHDKPISEELYRLATIVAEESEYDDDGEKIKEKNNESLHS
jgi:hypothetical protein